MLGIQFSSDDDEVFCTLSEHETDDYSDQVNSDIEIELYGKVHHSTNEIIFNLKTGMLNELESSSTANPSCNGNVTDQLLVVSSKPDVDNQECSNLQNNARTPSIKRRKIQLNSIKKKVRMKASSCEESDESNISSDVSFLCVDKWTAGSDNFMTNVQDNSLGNSNGTSVTEDKDIICISDNDDGKPIPKKKKRLRENFKPIVIDDEDSSVESSGSEDVLSKSLPIRLPTYEISKASSSNAWHIDSIDANPPKRGKKPMQRFYHKQKFCIHCKQAHESKFCPRSMKCFLCGGSHKSAFCKNKVCGVCFQMGHHCFKCPNKRKISQTYCEICKLRGHTLNLCPDIWRRFHATTSGSESIVQSPKSLTDSGPKFCYNCGVKGHFGHECPRPKPRFSCSPPWPYVISYKDPKQSVSSKSCEPPNMDRAKRRSSMLPKRGRNRQSPMNNSTPVTSGILQQGRPFSKRKNISSYMKRQLCFQEQDFLRTPNGDQAVPPKNVSFIKKRRNRNKSKKRKQD